MRSHSRYGHKSELLNFVFRTTSEFESRVVIGAGAIGEAGRIISQSVTGKRIAVLTQPAIANWATPLVEELKATGKFETSLIDLPDGEDCKSADVLLSVWDKLQQLKFARSDCLVAVGGGALTDLAGFAAASYLRGIPLVLIPTTLLAQVDAAIGGKTGINLKSGKNLAGAFYFPAAVIVDPETLATLPEREVRSGLGEIIKYAFIEQLIAKETPYRQGPATLLSLLKSLLLTPTQQPVLPQASDLEGIVGACIKMKLAVVGKDPHEKRLRRCLNLGHTLGHAIEKVSKYKWSHGEAVSIGLVYACRLGEHSKRWSSSNTAEVVSLLNAAGLPTEVPQDLSREELLAAMSSDKKRQAGSIKFVLPVAEPGMVDVDVDFSIEELGAAL